MKLVMKEEVRQVAGEWYRPRRDRHVHRWGKEDGYCVVDGQKAPIPRARLRTKENQEYALGSYWWRNASSEECKAVARFPGS